tara:strand:+ start:214 stop:444 length:231 start_codon:yes stop_codon:yes gene_type:complete
MEDSKIVIINHYTEKVWYNTVTFHYIDREDFLNAFFNEVAYCKLKGQFVKLINQHKEDVYLHPSEIEKCEVSIIKL